MIKSIIFDLGNVIQINKTNDFAKKFAKKHGVNEKKFLYEWKNMRNNFLDLDKLTPADFAKSLNKKFKLSLRQDDYFNEYFKFVHVDKKLLRRIRKKLKVHYKLAILSDNNRIVMRNLFENVNIKEIFSVIVISYKVKVKKPNPKIYRILLKKLKTKPEECLFIDDKSKNIAGARRIGMNGIVYKNWRQLRKEFKKYSVLF